MSRRDGNADDVAVVLESSRLLLRRLSENDAEDLAGIYSDPEVMRYILPPCADPVERARSCIEEQQRLYAERGFGLWATVYKRNDALIGRCGLLPWEIGGSREVELGYLLAKRYWGLGLATEAAIAVRDHAFENLGLTRVVCQVHPGNIASQRVAEKCGMKREGDVDVCGVPCRIYAMGDSAKENK